MDYQALFNAAFAVLLMVAGWVMKGVFDALRELRVKDDAIAHEVHSLAVAMPINYVHKNDFKELTEAMFRKLDRIEDKLDGKADKGGAQ